MNGTAQVNGLHGIGKTTASRVFTLEKVPNLEKLKSLCSRSVEASDYPNCKNVSSNIPIYDLRDHEATDTAHVNALQDEWYTILHEGPGVFVLKNFEQRTSLLKRTNEVFENIIAVEASSTKGDHFAASGKNSRIWNSFQKHAERDPASFVEYYSNPWLEIVSEAWLGPGYQVTAQVNIVKPGGAPQMPHRDYHLGFQTRQACARWPKGMHNTSQFLTLQGAVAHSHMPLESGPTRLLPFSQQLENGFLVWQTQELRDYFHENWVSAPLELGDAVFFNPALFHAAGENIMPESTGINRSANLLQISSPFGRTMETIDTLKIIESCWDELVKKAGKEGFESPSVVSSVRAISEGYPFPTNLDNRPPAPGGMAPESETEILLKALKNGLSKTKIINELQALRVAATA